MPTSQQKAAIFDERHSYKWFHNSVPMIDDRASQTAGPSEGVQAERKLVSHLQIALADVTCRLKEEIRERKRLESDIADVAEWEQCRLGQELHDGLGQQLTGIAYHMSALDGKLETVAPSLAKTARKLAELLQDSVEQTRKLAKGFYPVTLERDGLISAVLELAQYTQQAFGVCCAVQAGTVGSGKLPESLAIQLFRIAQEAVHNAVKHARAKHVIIHLATTKGDIALQIEDDGNGLPDDVESSNGMGLRIMQYRARSIHATLEFRNREAGGTLISCVVPASSWLRNNRNGDRTSGPALSRAVVQLTIR